MAKPKKGHIYLLWGPDRANLTKTEYPSKRSVITLLHYINDTIKRRNKGNYVSVYYEDDNFPFSMVTYKDLLLMGIIDDEKHKRFVEQNTGEMVHINQIQLISDPKIEIK